MIAKSSGENNSRKTYVLLRRGYWTERYDESDEPLFRRKFVCSACGKWNGYGMPRYCPKCGARMDLEVPEK